MHFALRRSIAAAHLILLVATVSACAKPEVPAGWRDVIPEKGMQKVNDIWVSVYTGQARIAEIDTPEAHGRITPWSNYGLPMGRSDYAKMWYDKALSAAELRAAFELQV
jgi:hypothetical protein